MRIKVNIFGTSCLIILATTATVRKLSVYKKGAFLLPDPAAQGSFLAFPKIFRGKIVQVNNWHCFEKIGQWLENVDQALLVLASGTLVLQKMSVNISPEVFSDSDVMRLFWLLS